MYLSILTFLPLLRGNADICVVLIVILLAVIAGLCIYFFVHMPRLRRKRWSMP